MQAIAVMDLGNFDAGFRESGSWIPDFSIPDPGNRAEDIREGEAGW